MGLAESELEILSNVDPISFFKLVKLPLEVFLLEVCSSRISIWGPMTDRMTGSRTRPWVTPRITIENKEVKTVLKIVLVLNASGMTPRNVERPPSRIDDPMVSRVSFTRPSLVLYFDS